MKYVLSVVFIFVSFSSLADSMVKPELKSCTEWTANQPKRVCIDIWKISEQDKCTNTIKSGVIWTDEFSTGAIDGMFTTEKNYCDLLFDVVPYGGKNYVVELTYCCGG